MNYFKKTVRGTIEIFSSIQPTFLVYFTQFLTEFLLVYELIEQIGAWLKIFPNVEQDGARLLRWMISAWLINLLDLLMSESDVGREIQEGFYDAAPQNWKPWIIAQERLENCLRKIPSLSLAAFSLKIGQRVVKTFFDLYIYFWSADYKYLIRLAKNKSDRHWAYFLTKELVKYSVGYHFWEWIQPFEQQKTILRIYSLLENDEIEFSLRDKAIGYVKELKIKLFSILKTKLDN